MNIETIKEAARLLNEIEDFESSMVSKLDCREGLELHDDDVKLENSCTRETIWLTEFTKEDKATIVRWILHTFEGRINAEIDRRKKRLQELGVAV